MVRLHSYKATVPIRLGPWIGLETSLISQITTNLYNLWDGVTGLESNNGCKWLCPWPQGAPWTCSCKEGWQKGGFSGHGCINTVAKLSTHPSDESTPTVLTFEQMLHHLPRETTTQCARHCTSAIKTTWQYYTSQPEAQNWRLMKLTCHSTSKFSHK